MKGLDQRFAHGDQLEPDQYPVLHSISPAFMYQFIPVLEDQLVTPEYA